MYVCMHVCMCMYACMYVCMHACMHVWVYVCMYAFMHVCMYACMRICVYISITLYQSLSFFRRFVLSLCCYVLMSLHCLNWTLRLPEAASPGTEPRQGPVQRAPTIWVGRRGELGPFGFHARYVHVCMCLDGCMLIFLRMYANRQACSIRTYVKTCLFARG